MLYRARAVVIRYRAALLVMLCVVLLGAAYALGRSSASEQTAAEKTAVMTQEQTQDAEQLRAQLDISSANADALQKRLAEAQAGGREADQGGRPDTAMGGEGKDRSDGRHADHKGQGWQAVAN